MGAHDLGREKEIAAVNIGSKPCLDLMPNAQTWGHGHDLWSNEVRPRWHIKVQPPPAGGSLGCSLRWSIGAVILFSTVRVPSSAAHRFRTLALDVKSAFSRFDDASVFNQTLLSTVGAART